VAIEASDLGEIARNLARVENRGEVLARTVTSRAYYWAFHVAQEYAVTKGYRLGKKHSRKSHQALWSWFYANHLDQIATLGFTLKKYRVTADYKLSRQFKLPKHEALELAGRICELVKAAP
jgi:uncharacterized protein (UPF0332 family)